MYTQLCINIIIIMDPALTCVQVHDNPAKHKTIESTHTHTCNTLLNAHPVLCVTC